MKRRKLYIILAAILFLLAAGFTAYPLAANYINDRHQSLIQTDYSTAIKKLDNTDITAARQAALAYNENLKPIRYDRDAVDAASVSYEEQLNLTGSGIMGYVEIPKLGVNLPIYHGTEETVLQKGVGHLIPFPENDSLSGIQESADYIEIDLRQALPSVFLRPHAQHAYAIRRKVHGDHNDVESYDLAHAVIGVLKIRIDRVNEWLGEGHLLSQDNLFPPPAYDYGYDLLLDRSDFLKDSHFSFAKYI